MGMAKVLLAQLYAHLFQIMPYKPAPSQVVAPQGCARPHEASPGCGKTATTESGAQIWDPKGQQGQWGALCTLTHYLSLVATC